MYPIPPTETLVQTKTCRHCSVSFPITDKDLEFYEKVSPVFNGKKYSIPSPALCPDCRQQRRLSFRNERKLYKRKCDATGRDIISIYSPDKPFKVYHQDFWWSDKWDPMEYGRDFDFGRGFFEQFGEMGWIVPKMGQIAFNNENSPYANFATNNRDIYLSPDILDSNNVYYSSTIKKVEDGVDLLDVVDSANCYECVGSQRLHNCKYCIWSADCRDSIHLYGCHNVQNSMYCVNVDNKKYCLLNKEISESEYNRVLQEIKNGNTKQYEGQYRQLLSSHPQKPTRVFNAEDSSGDLLKNTKRVVVCFQSINIEDCRYVAVWFDMRDCMDTTIHNPECIIDYEAISGGKLKSSAFNIICWESDRLIYCSDCFSSSHLFGCIGLHNKQYCILNKQYTREEYEAIVPRIIEHMQKTGEWWEFFPSTLSPFGYNETVAQEYYPLDRRDVSEKHLSPNGRQIFNWSDYEAPFPRVEKIIPADKLPDDITKIPDDILNWAIECEVTKKPFRIIKQELEFYRKHNLPIPRRHPDQRHLDRMALRNPRKLFERKCDKCGVEMVTTYAPERKEMVYCESCYNTAIIG